MTVVILGATGQLGRALAEALPNAHLIQREQLALPATQSEIDAVITPFKPEVVINCTAYTQVDKAEQESDLCFAINTDSVIAMAKACHSLGARFITFSSDYVFDGTHVEGGYREGHATNPLSIYGQSKAKAEETISHIPNTTTIRTSWLFGEGHNFVRTMLALSDKGLTSLSIVDDQIGRPTYATDLAAAVVQLLALESLPKILHITNGGEAISWAEFAKTIFTLAHKDVSVIPVTTQDYYANKTDYAVRPLYSELNTDLLEQLGITLPTWHEALKRYVTKKHQN